MFKRQAKKIGTALTGSSQEVFRILNRGAATEKALRDRMKSVDGIRKISQSMKLVAAARVRQSQVRLDVVRSFQKGISEFWPQPAAEKKQEGEAKDQVVFVPITADRGLCGAANANVARRTRNLANALVAKQNPFNMVPIGIKGKNALAKLFGNTFTFGINECAKLRLLTFRLASMVAIEILKQPADKYVIVYNWFRNLLVYETKDEEIPSFSKVKGNLTALFGGKFEVESGGYSDTLRNLYEYRFAVRVFHCMQEAMTVEIAARMNAMGNSSKAAADILAMLTMEYNRTRQAKITTELVEVVSGALFVKSD